MTAYVAPDQATLRASVSRDLHDLENKVFSTAEVNDLINEGIAEANLLLPKEYRATIALVDDQFEYDLPDTVTAIFRVEMWRDTDGVMTFWRDLPRREDTATTGWDFFAGTLLIPTTWSWDTDEQDSLLVMGYQDRDPLSDDEETLDGTLQVELVIRSYARFTCFQRLIASRALFQQWQTSANNSDVSPTQLLGMASVYSREWRELRNRVRRLRRSD